MTYTKFFCFRFSISVPLGVQLLILYGLTGHIPGLRPSTTLEVIKMYLFPNSGMNQFDFFFKFKISITTS